MAFLKDRDFSDIPSIPEFYKGQTIFITGGSGFMGQVLIEKLLYSCTDLDRIYLLLRNKKGVKSEDRLEALYASSCFNRLREQMPEVFKSKVSVIHGDVTELGLGLSDEDRTLIVNKVNIIFHVAASVRFDDTLQYAVKINIRGTRDVIELAKSVKNLSVLVHVSTTYANAKNKLIEEKLYPPYANWRDTVQICEVMDEHSLRVLTDKYLDGLPNTYVFTKQLAENVVAEQRGKLPVVIIRPSVVVSSEKEPMPGWTNNFNGPTGIAMAGGKGILRTFYAEPDAACDYIPIDISIKNFIAAAWVRGTKKLQETDDVEIYNCCANDLIQFSIRDLIEHFKVICEEIPPPDMIWPPSMHVTTSKTSFHLRVLIKQVLPAIIIDSVLWLLGKKPLLMKIQRRIFAACLALRYFLVTKLTFDNTNFLLLRSRIKKQDCEQFYYDLESIDKMTYMKVCTIGGKLYLLKESLDDVPRAVANYKRLKMIRFITQFVVYSYAILWILNLSFVKSFLSFNQ